MNIPEVPPYQPQEIPSYDPNNNDPYGAMVLRFPTAPTADFESRPSISPSVEQSVGSLSLHEMGINSPLEDIPSDLPGLTEEEIERFVAGLEAEDDSFLSDDDQKFLQSAEVTFTRTEEAAQAEKHQQEYMAGIAGAIHMQDMLAQRRAQQELEDERDRSESSSSKSKQAQRKGPARRYQRQASDIDLPRAA